MGRLNFLNVTLVCLWVKLNMRFKYVLISLILRGCGNFFLWLNIVFIRIFYRFFLFVNFFLMITLFERLVIVEI